MTRELLICPKCQTQVLIKRGFATNGAQRYYCHSCDYYTLKPLKPQDVLILRKIDTTLKGEQKKEE